MKTKKLVLSALFIALGVSTSHLIAIPVGVSKCFPVQHLINVLSAVLLGPFYALWNAIAISTLRNLLGVGTLLAFPGSIFGAFLAGLLYKWVKKILPAVIGEIFGTGIIGSLASYPVAKFLMGTDLAFYFFVVPFLVSTIGGSIIGYLILKIMIKRKSFENWINSKK